MGRRTGWLEKERGKEAGELRVGEVVRVTSGRQANNMNVGVAGELAGDTVGGELASSVAIEHDDDAPCGADEVTLGPREGRAEQRDGGQLELVQPHDGPGTLNDSERAMPLGRSTVPRVDDVVLWQSWWEFPLWDSGTG